MVFPNGMGQLTANFTMFSLVRFAKSIHFKILIYPEKNLVWLKVRIQENKWYLLAIKLFSEKKGKVK